jgi:hypothetical protein
MIAAFNRLAIGVAAFVALLALSWPRIEAGTTGFSSQQTLPAGIVVQPGTNLSGQAIRIGESVAATFDPRTSGLARPVGSWVTARDGASAYAKVGTGNTAWEKLGAGAFAGDATRPGQLTARAAFLTGISPTALTCWRDEYVYNPTTLGINSNSGTGTVGTAVGDTVGGRLTVSSGATAASIGLHTSAATVFGRPDTNRFYVAVRSIVQTTIDAQTSIGVGASINALNNSWMLGVCGATSTVNYTFQYDGIPPCSGTVVNSGIAVSVGTAVLFEVWGVADGKLHAAIDGTELSGSPFTMASSPTNSMRTYITAKNGTTAAARTVDLDFYQACWSET